MSSIDDREAREMLGPLAGEPGGEQWLDLDHIVREGDRRRRVRTAVTGAFTAVFLTAVAAGTAAIVVNGRQGDGGVPTAGRGSASPGVAPVLPPAATGPDCTLAALPGPTGLLAAVDHTGHYTLQEAKAGTRTTVTVRKDGVQVARVSLPSSTRGDYAVNAEGEFTALLTDLSKDTPVLVSHAYTAGKLTTMSAGSIATGIADDGRLAGVAENGEPALWERPSEAPRKLAVPVGKQAQVMFVDQDGTMLGYANSEGSEFANLWLPDGSSRALPSPDGRRSPAVWGINNGWVAGFDDAQGFRYHVGTNRYERLPAQIRRPHTVASNGAVVGDDGTDGHLWTLDGGVARKLQVTPARHYQILGISDDGRTVTGNEYLPAPASDPDREAGRAVTWTCG